MRFTFSETYYVTPKGTQYIYHALLFNLQCFKCVKKQKSRHFQGESMRQHLTLLNVLLCCSRTDKMPFEKAYFGVRYVDLEQNFHAWVDFVGEYEFLVKTVSSRRG